MALVALIATLTSCGGSSTVRTLASLPPATCALLDERVGLPLPGGEALRPPFNSSLLDHLLGFFTLDADWDAIVYMQADAAPDAIDAIRARLTSDSRVDSFVYLDHAAAHAEFRSLFADQPQIANSLTAAETPTSFKLKLKDTGQAQSLDDSLKPQPGVYSVIAPSDALKSAVVAQFRQMKPRLAALRKSGVTPALLRLVDADDKLAGRMNQHPVSRIVGPTGVFSDAEAAQLAEAGSQVRSEVARDCTAGASS